MIIYVTILFSMSGIQSEDFVKGHLLYNTLSPSSPSECYKLYYLLTGLSEVCCRPHTSALFGEPSGGDEFGPTIFLYTQPVCCGIIPYDP